MLHDNLVDVFRDHWSRLVVLRVDIVVEVRDDHGELLLGLLVEVRHGDTSRQDGIVGVCHGHVRGSLGSLCSKKLALVGAEPPGCPYQVIQLDGVDTLVDTRDDLLGDSSSIDMFRVEAVTQPRHTGSDLVELHAFFASVCEVSRQQLILT